MGQIEPHARAAGLKTLFLGPEGGANVSLSKIAGESAEGLLVTKPKNYDQVPANKPLVDAIKAKKPDPSGAFVWTTYAALQSLQAGLNQSDDPAEIAKYLKANSVDTVMGPLMLTRSKRKNRTQAAHSSGPPTPRCNLCRRA